MRITITLAVISLAFLYGFGQTCSITADSIVCKDELLSFSANASSGANSYIWNFGDGNTSTVQNIAKSYSSYGKKYVTLTVGFTGGGSCVAKDTIMVHDLPVASFNLSGSTYCISDHEICLTDQSSMGATTSVYERRIILWGDGGNTNSNNPQTGQTICYSSYPQAGNYTLTVEVQNDKGCENIWQEDIQVLREFKPSFLPQLGAPNCNTQTVCLSNDSSQPADLKSFIWHLGDGNIDSSRWSRPCHAYPESKPYTATLEVTLDNGCSSEISENFTTAFQDVLPDISYDSAKCYPEEFFVRNAPIFFANYTWVLFNTNMDTVDLAFGQITSLEPPEPGTYFIQGRIILGDCDTTSPLYQVESLGIKPDFMTLNRERCDLGDTAYFLNLSTMHPTAQPSYLWEFYDSFSSSICSTAMLNCNFDTGANSMHYYSEPDCYYPVLIAKDMATGCIDSIGDTLSRRPSTNIEFKAMVGRACYGGKEEYGVGFSSNLCNGQVLFMPDSSCNKSWIEYKGGHVYGNVCDSNGWVSPAFLVIQGDNKVYRSADSNDFYIDNNKICVDTLYYPNMFRLHPEPPDQLSLIKDDCLPLDMQWVYNGDRDSSFAKIIYNWGVQGVPVTELQVYRDTFPEIKYTYTEAGDYAYFIMVEDTNGCFFSRGMGFPPLTIKVGYFNTFTADSIICPNVDALFRDSVLYWLNGTQYWRDTLRANAGLEQISWDFGDGKGFITSGALPYYSFPQKGNYTVRMATKDANGCTDTVSKIIRVGGVNAVIQNANTEYLCDQIVQFFDSSYSDYADMGDEITGRVWDFGDNTTPSLLKDPFHYYDENGYFTLSLAVKNDKGCVDTARLEIYMRGPQPYFDIISDTVGCTPFRASFSANGDNISEFVFHMGDPSNTTISAQRDTTVHFIYNQPGIYNIYLVGSDSFYNPQTQNYYTCKETFPDTTDVIWPSRQIIVLPVPEVDFINSEPLCVGEEVTFTSTADTVYKTFNWDIGGVEYTSLAREHQHTFNDSGYHTIIHYPTYDAQAPYFVVCSDTVQKQIYLSVAESRFSWEQIDNCSGFRFFDSSVNAVSWNWDFGHPISGDKNTSELQYPQHNFRPDTGSFEICLTIENDLGCISEACSTVHSTYREISTLYNVFTPGNDGLNDDFGMDIEGHDLYDMEIYNRWGEMVFRSTSKRRKWNGKYFNTGDDLPSGTYFYIFKYRFECTGEEEESHGMVELIR